MPRLLDDRQRDKLPELPALPNRRAREPACCGGSGGYSGAASRHAFVPQRAQRASPLDQAGCRHLPQGTRGPRPRGDDLASLDRLIPPLLAALLRAPGPLLYTAGLARANEPSFQTGCSICPAGTYAYADKGAGVTTCVQCAPGFANNLPGSIKCPPCNPDT